MENLSALPQATDRDENVLSGRIRLDGLLSNWKEALPFLAIALQLALLIWICRRFHLEHEAFAGSFLTLTAIGFVIHHCLPQSQRLNFLALLSLATYMTVLGVRDGLSLIVISVTFIVVARLPVRLPIRVTILMGMALFLTYLRSNHIMVPWSDAIWPILWSMLLFRLIIYLFDLRHGKVPTTWQHAMAYFFLLPNVVFPLFPPIDYAAFWRSYYQGDPCRTYQQGIRWMFVGVLHLLVYRYIDYYWIESPEVIISSKSLIQYVIASYLLIIRLSGQFHLIVGILHLFGFGLPRCMDHYFLATGFTDYWRRVNIYWKDFIQKVVYYPAHFRLKSFSNTTKLVIATLCGFFATWFFHSTQWFGLRGSWMLSWTDVFFWSSLAVLVLATSLYESRYGRKRSLVRKRAALSEIFFSGLKATGVFVVMAILWSIWISPSFATWWNLVTRCQVSLVDATVTLVVVGATICGCLYVKDKLSIMSWSEPKILSRATLLTLTPIVLVAFLGLSEVSSMLGSRLAQVVLDLRTAKLNKKHDSMQFQGYYEQLNDVNDFNFRLYSIYSKKPLPITRTKKFLNADGRIAVDRFVKDSRGKDDVVGSILKPNLSMVQWNGKPYRTNRWGMRDADYALEPSTGTKRIALLGGSISLGRGVADGENYEALTEIRLNREQTRAGCDRFEILNFSVGRHGGLQRLIMLEQKATSFQPDIVLMTSHLEDNRPDIRHLSQTSLAKIPYPEVVDLIRGAGVKEDTPEEEIQARLFPYWEKLLLFYWTKAVTLSHASGIKIALVLIPSRPEERDPDRIRTLREYGKRVGFDAVIDLSGVYDGYKPQEIWLSDDDTHPNELGHRLIAQQLYENLVETSGVSLGMFTPSSRTERRETSEIKP